MYSSCLGALNLQDLTFYNDNLMQRVLVNELVVVTRLGISVNLHFSGSIVNLLGVLDTVEFKFAEDDVM